MAKKLFLQENVCEALLVWKETVFSGRTPEPFAQQYLVGFSKVQKQFY